MSLKPFLDNRYAEFTTTFRSWFLRSSLHKSVAVVSRSRLTLSLFYGQLQNKKMLVFASTSGHEFLSYLEKNKVGFLCATENLDDMCGDDLIQRSLLISPQTASILIVEETSSTGKINQVYKSSVVVAVDDMLKQDNVLRRGILCALGGASYRSPSINAFTNNESACIVKLSDTERKILEYFAAGMTIDEMVEQLPFSKNTIKTYSRNLLNKLGVGNRQKALLKALELGIIKNIFKSV